MKEKMKRQLKDFGGTETDKQFMSDNAITGINSKLADLAQIDGQDISLSVDLSSKRAWEDFFLSASSFCLAFHCW